MLRFIRILAVHERALDRVKATDEKLGKIFFGPDKIADAIIAEWDGVPCGHALYYRSISSYLAEPMVYLEDVVVDPAYRSKGIGRALMATVAKRGVAFGAVRMYWSALEWNAGAIALYQKIGAEQLSGALSFKLQDQQLKDFAKEASSD